MQTAITLLVMATSLVLSVLLALMAEEFLMKGFFRIVYARQQRPPEAWVVTRPR